MQTIDPQKAARVWSRVQGGDDSQALSDLIALEWLDAVTYLTLSRRFQGRDSVILRQLAQQEQDHVACLRGIYTLQTGGRPSVSTPKVPREDTRDLLRRCYGSHMHRLARYERRSADPEYGQIFHRLADQERHQCQQILSLLGRLKR